MSNIKTKIANEIARTIVDSWESEDGIFWYRLWSDGWVEQGGVTTGTLISGIEETVTFSIEMKDMNYHVQVSQQTYTHINSKMCDADAVGYVKVDTTSLRAQVRNYAGNTEHTKVAWRVEGYSKN